MGVLGAIAAPILAGTAGGVINKLLGGGASTTLTQQPLETPEQAEARQMLLQFTQTGQLGPTAAGGAYTGSLGDFSMTPTETDAMGKLSTYVNSGMPAIYGAGAGVMNDLLTTDKYNPMAAGGAYDAYKAEADNNTTKAEGQLKNSQAFSGNLYSSNTGKQAGNIASQGAIALNSKLGDMYQTYVGQKLNAAQQAPAFAEAGQTLEMNPITAGLTYGSLPRDLENQSDQAQLSNYLRQHTDLMNAVGTVAGQNTPYGVPSVTVPSVNPLTSTINTATSTAMQEYIRQLFAQGKTPTTTNSGDASAGYPV